MRDLHNSQTVNPAKKLVGQRAFLICFAGNDGAGKTTVARNLASTLRKQGYNSVYVYARFKPLFSYPIFWAATRFVRKNRGNQYRDYVKARNFLAGRHSKLKALYDRIVLVDYAIQLAIKVRVRLARRMIVVCDRYIYDTVVSDLTADFENGWEKRRDLIDFALAISPRPNLSVVIDVPESLSLLRKPDIISPEYLPSRRQAFIEVAHRENLPVFDGTDSLQSVSTIISSTVAKALRS